MGEMQKRMTTAVTVALLLAACSTAYGVESAGQLPAAAEQLMQLYPGAAVHKDQNRVRIIYGVPMTPGLDARSAAESFIQAHGEAFDCGKLTVQPDWSADFADGSKTVFVYQQYLAGLPVEYGCLKVLVLNGPVPRVIYAAGTLAASPGEAGFPAAKLDGPAAVQLVRAARTYRDIPLWGAPEKVVYQGNGDWSAPVVAWKFVGESKNPSDKLRKTFFVDAATGRVLQVRDEIYYSDVTGSIQGMGSPGLYPDASYNPPALVNLPEMRAQIAGGNSAFTDDNGLFTIVNSGTSPVTVSCGVNGVGAGEWVSVVPTALTPITASVPSVTPPGPANLLLNGAPSEQLTAQVNAFTAATITHNFIKQFAPSLNRWDVQLTCNTGVTGTCNAFYSSNTINFFNSGGGCANTAYTTVVSHEFGHWIVSRLGVGGTGLPQNAFGEGYGDTNAELLWNDNVVGRGFLGTQSSYVRDPIASNIQYPCSQEIHTCGMVISGAWWRIRSNFANVYGDPVALERARQLEVNWALITTGGPDSSNAAGPGTAIEVLTTDDDNGNINDGTPNYTSICGAFAAHGIPCPPIQPISFLYPAGHPALLVPNQPTAFGVNVVGVSGTPEPGSGTLTYRVNGGSFSTVPMTEGAPNQYTAVLPAVPCGTAIDYYLSAQTTSATSVSDPLTAPTSSFASLSTSGLNTIFSDSFETDLGWSGVAPDDTATTGRWTRNVSQATAAQPGGDHTTGTGQCWVTDYHAGTSIGDFDVDNGQTTLTSPSLDLSGSPDSIIGYWRWYSNNQGASPNADIFTVDISNDNGTTWVNAETVGPAGPEAGGGWYYHEFRVGSFVTPTANIRVRYIASDLGSPSIVEAAVDDFVVKAVTCANSCYANCDGSTTAPVLNALDFACFLNRFAAGDTYANCDGSTAPPVLNVLDFACFINAFAAGCP
jgi:hypothetical protein